VPSHRLMLDRLAAYALCLFAVLAMACGKSGENAKIPATLTESPNKLPALIARYSLQIDGMPMIGPQAEALTLTLSDNFAKCENDVQIELEGEISKVRRSFILDYRAKQEALLTHLDSSFQVKSYTMHDSDSFCFDLIDSLSPEMNRLIISVTGEVADLNGLSGCRKLLISFGGTTAEKDEPLTTLNGHIWVKQDIAAGENLSRYYAEIGRFFRDSAYGGVELWSVLKNLGLGNCDLGRLAAGLEGLIVAAELSCEKYVLGKRAKISVKMTLQKYSETHISLADFNIPVGYKNPLGERIGP